MKNDIRLLRALMMKRAKQLGMGFINTDHGLTITKFYFIGKLSKEDEIEIKKIADFFEAKTLFILPEPDFEEFDRIKKQDEEEIQKMLRNENSSGTN
jgi:hypothetical protein